MTTYKEVNGTAVQSLANNTGTIEGQIWYDTDNNAFKLEGYSTGTWSSGGALPASIGANSGSGSTTAGFSMGGGTGPTPSYVSATNTYNGTAWTGAPVMPFTSAYAGACGTIPTTIYVGGDGNAPGASATYNGTTWASIPAIGFDGYQIKAAGDSANAFAAQGYYSSSGRTYDGSSWTVNSVVPQHNYTTSAVGTYNDASFLGGIAVVSGPGSVHLNWNGSSWSSRTAMPVSGGTGGQSSGNAPTSSFWVQATVPTTLNWDGSSWTTVGSLSTPRANGAGGGSSSAEGFIAGGPTAGSTTTEEFAAGVVTKTLTTT